MPLEIRGAHFLIRSAQLVREHARIGPEPKFVFFRLHHFRLVLRFAENRHSFAGRHSSSSDSLLARF